MGSSPPGEPRGLERIRRPPTMADFYRTVSVRPQDAMVSGINVAFDASVPHADARWGYGHTMLNYSRVVVGLG